jgi:predicted NAD-dependent protein-ADP-ribosyltransferase YbiA (DUF1768 family)
LVTISSNSKPASVEKFAETIATSTFELSAAAAAAEPASRMSIVFHSAARSLGKGRLLELGFPKETGKILSNFYEGQELSFKGRAYASVENAFQGFKYECLVNPASAPKIESADFAMGGAFGKTALAAKKAGGRRFMSKHGVALDIKRWNAMSASLMEELIEAKVEQSKEIQGILRLCGAYNVSLFHHSRADMKWGCHVDHNSETIKTGENLLGEIYMAIARRRYANS